MPVSMVDTSAFLPLILPNCPECPDFVAAAQARFAAIEFCERSRAWRHLTTVAMLSAATDVTVAPDTAAIHEIEYAEFDGRPLTPVQFSTIDRLAEGPPRYVTQASPNTVTVSPFTAGTLEISLFLKPLASSQFGTVAGNPLTDRFNVVPDFLVSVHGTAIAYGALSRILAIPRETWSNPAESMRFAALFEEKLNGAFRANMRGQQRAPIRTQTTWF